MAGRQSLQNRLPWRRKTTAMHQPYCGIRSMHGGRFRHYPPSHFKELPPVVWQLSTRLAPIFMGGEASFTSVVPLATLTLGRVGSSTRSRRTLTFLVGASLKSTRHLYGPASPFFN